jgi:hypothetical protein
MNRILTCTLVFLGMLLPASILNFSVTSSPIQKTDLLEYAVRPAGVDLDVTYIQRTPLYYAYCVDYPNDIPRQCPGTEFDRRWPEPGEVVTFTAHIVNKGTDPSGAVGFQWTIDGAVVATGLMPSLASNIEATTEFAWAWDHSLEGERALGDHKVGFRIDPQDAIPETYETNNFLEDDTRAISLRIVITPEMYAAYDIPVDPALPWSAEDWLQKQIAAMNANFARSKYPTTPEGATQRVRIDTILISPDNPPRDLHFDGGWFVDADYRHGASAWYDPLTDIDWALMHELSHQLGMIDLYMSDVPYDNVQVLDQHERPANFSFTWPNGGLMGGGDISPYTDFNIYSSHSAAGVSTQRGYRGGYYGIYQYDIPLHNSLRILDSMGNPVAGAQVRLYQRSGPYNSIGQPVIDNIPEISGTTVAGGLLELPNRSAAGGVLTRTDHTLHDNPFGVVDIIHTKNRFLGNLRFGSHEEFFWLDITDFNLAYWGGDTESYTYTISSHIPVSGAPDPPSLTSQRVEANRVSLCWRPNSTAGIAYYQVYRAEQPVYAYQLTGSLITDLCYEDEHPDEGFTYGGYIYAVTAVDRSGRESGFSDFAWAGNLRSPRSVVVRQDTDRILLAPSWAGYGLLRQQADGRYLGYLGSPDPDLENARYIGLDANGNFLLSSSGCWADENHKILVLDPDGKMLFKFGTTGANPGQFQDPAGVTAWGPRCSIEGPYQEDGQTLLLLHFDGSYLGVQGEQGIPTGTTFVPGRYGQGVRVGAGERITYALADNLDPQQGAIEFWVKPEWDGDDEESYIFVEVGDGWFNRLRVMKDGANNLRFMVWDSTTEYGVAYNVAHWQEGEWHHVAATWGDNQIDLYEDGKLVDSSVANLPNMLLGPIYIGPSLSYQEFAMAVIDELRISSLPRLGNSLSCNRILVVDSGNHRIQAFDALGRFLSSFGSYGNGPGQFKWPQGIAVDQHGRVLVTDRDNQRLVVLGFDGMSFVYQNSYMAGFDIPYGIAVDGKDQVYIADAGKNRIMVLGADGALIKEFDAPTDGYTGKFNEPVGVAVGADGVIVVVDAGNRRMISIHDPQPPALLRLPVVARYALID